MCGSPLVGGSVRLTPEPPLGAGQSAEVGGWRVYHYALVDSTNLVAARLPAFHAVRSDRQSAGRGRFQRAWVSDAGGLWLSAVVPLESSARALLPLAMGVAVIQALADAGASGLRMRWPNDVMAGNRKLAGLLIDQFHAGRAVVGVGINVTNRPEIADASLSGKVARLGDLLVPCPPLEPLAARVLSRIRQQYERLRSGAFATSVSDLATIWNGSRQVLLELDHGTRTGRFGGVDAAGRLRLVQPDGSESFFAAHEVRHLTEIQTDP